MARKGQLLDIYVEAIPQGRKGQLLDIYVEAVGTVVQVQVVPDVEVKALTAITTTITLTGGGTADTYDVQQNSGPVVVLTTPGGHPEQRTWQAPGTVAGDVIQLELTATKDGVTSPPVVVNYTVLPCQLLWHNNGAPKWIRHQEP